MTSSHDLPSCRVEYTRGRLLSICNIQSINQSIIHSFIHSFTHSPITEQKLRCSFICYCSLCDRLNMRKKAGLSALSGSLCHMKSVAEHGFFNEFAFDNKALKTFVEFRKWWKLCHIPSGCILPGEPKKNPPPTTFVDITAMHGNFCTKFYTIVKRSNIHFITKFYCNISGIDKATQF